MSLQDIHDIELLIDDVVHRTTTVNPSHAESSASDDEDMSSVHTPKQSNLGINESFDVDPKESIDDNITNTILSSIEDTENEENTTTLSSDDDDESHSTKQWT